MKGSFGIPGSRTAQRGDEYGQGFHHHRRRCTAHSKAESDRFSVFSSSHRVGAKAEYAHSESLSTAVPTNPSDDRASEQTTTTMTRNSQPTVHNQPCLASFENQPTLRSGLACVYMLCSSETAAEAEAAQQKLVILVPSAVPPALPRTLTISPTTYCSATTTTESDEFPLYFESRNAYRRTIPHGSGTGRACFRGKTRLENGSWDA